MEPQLRTCRYCGSVLDISKFELANTIKGVQYRRWKCQKCKQATQTKRKEKSRDWLLTLKQDIACARCGLKDYRVLDFHHADPDRKEYAVSNMLSWSRSRILAEIEKCTPLCSNCHRIHHWELREAAKLSG